MSHLLQMRGLKRELAAVQARQFKSHLLQMRGLKHQDQKYDDAQRMVASFTDAWIETETWSRTANLDSVASFTDAWIETQAKFDVDGHILVASFTDAWIETSRSEI